MGHALFSQRLRTRGNALHPVDELMVGGSLQEVPSWPHLKASVSALPLCNLSFHLADRGNGAETPDYLECFLSP